MTNPDNAVRVRARNGGRASVYEANAWCQAYTSGLLEGEGVTQNTSADMNVLVGGSTTKPDVVLAENAAGYRIALDIVSQEAITITAPATNSRITAIVAYTDDLSLASSEDAVTGSPASCGLIAVNGTTAASPVAPTDTQIRSAITSDGATGSQAAYCVIATIAVNSDTTAIDDSMITMNMVTLAGSGVVKADNINIEETTQTLTFRYGSTVTGTYDAAMIPLDKNGLTMLMYNGTTGFSDSSSGILSTSVALSTPFSELLFANVDSWYFGSTEAYKTYSSISRSGGEWYVNKTTSSTQTRMVSLIMIGYMS